MVLVQHRPDLSGEDLDALAALGRQDRVAVAPSDALSGSEVVVATAWRQRMPLDRVRTDLLEAFVTGHADRAPAVTPCPAGSHG